MYVPYAQDPAPTVFVFAEAAAGNDAAVALTLRRAVRTLRPDLVVEDVELLPSVLDRSVRWWRFGAWLLGIFAALAVMLAAIGLMTTIGWWVNQRTRELGLRIALGATRANVTRLVFRQGLTLGAVGIAVGCLVAAGVTRFLVGWIYGVTPLDGPTFAGCALGMTGGRRALGVHPGPARDVGGSGRRAARGVVSPARILPSPRAFPRLPEKIHHA